MEIEKIEQNISCDLINQLRLQLAELTGVYPEELIDRIVQNRELVTPILLKNVDDFVNASPRDISEGKWREGIVSLFILGKFREQKAYPYLIKLCMMPYRVVDPFLGDIITDSMPALLASTFNGDLKSLHSIVTNQHLYEYVRISALIAHVILYQVNKISREEIVSFFDSLFDKLYDDFSYVPSELVSSCCDIRAVELADKIDWFYKNDIPNFLCLEHQETKDLLASSEDEGPLANYRRNRFGNLIDDLEFEMEWLFREDEPDALPCFEDEKEFEFKEDLEDEDAIPFVTTPKIGRNDLCPCSSGKKYKKCCGR